MNIRVTFCFGVGIETNAKGILLGGLLNKLVGEGSDLLVDGGKDLLRYRQSAKILIRDHESMVIRALLMS